MNKVNALPPVENKHPKPISNAKLTALAAVLVSGIGFSHASLAGTSPVVQYVTVGKNIENIQTSASNVMVNPAPQTATYGGPYGFSADVQGTNIGSLSPAPTVSGPIYADANWYNGGVLGYNSTNDDWELGSPYANDWGSPTLSDLNANFGSGIYTFNVSGATVALNLSGDAYANTPIVTLSGGFWSGGKYVIDVSQQLTITTNAFSAYGSYADGHMGLGVSDIGVEQFHSIAPGQNFLTLTIAANTLLAGNDYQGYAGFESVVDLQPNAALPGSYNAAYYGVSTGFTISAVPEPESYAMMLAGLGLMGFRLRRHMNSAQSISA